MPELIEPYLELRWVDAVDIVVVATLLWFVVQGVRRTRARHALVGLVTLGVIFLLARQLDLQLTARLLQGFFAVLVLVLVVIFQEDLRRLFEQVALVGLRRHAPPPAAVDTIVRSVVTLARTGVGALIVIPGRESIKRHTEGGVEIDGQLSEPLLVSLFDPHSPGHDGAVVIHKGRISAFAVHLPLSASAAGGGTRHAAALGLAERCDALCLVVSEERRTISVARDAVMRPVDAGAALTAEVSSAFAHAGFVTADGARVRWRWKEALVALGLAAILWLLVIPGAVVVEMQRDVPVSVSAVPKGLTVEAIDPPQTSG